MKTNSIIGETVNPETPTQANLDCYSSPQLSQIGESSDIQGCIVGTWYDNDSTFLWYD